MQVLAGKYRRRHLQSANSIRVRPAARRLREAIFETLGPRIAGARFLDLYAGFGAVGIEALSRGARHVTFVDRSRRMCSFIELNLGLCGVTEGSAEIFMNDAVDFLRRTSKPRNGVACERWDIAFFDPPYSADYLPVLRIFGAGFGLKRRGGLLLVEHQRTHEWGGRLGRLRLRHSLQQGESGVSFYTPDKPPEPASTAPPIDTSCV
jgi:16S rRNA (guanine(966)-N(2))-methyltransferase RsmD